MGPRAIPAPTTSKADRRQQTGFSGANRCPATWGCSAGTGSIRFFNTRDRNHRGCCSTRAATNTGIGNSPGRRYRGTMPGVSAQILANAIGCNTGSLNAGNTSGGFNPGNVNTGYQRRPALPAANTGNVNTGAFNSGSSTAARGPVITTGWSASPTAPKSPGSTWWIQRNPQPRSSTSIRSIFPACRCSTSTSFRQHRALQDRGLLDVPTGGAGHPRNDGHPPIVFLPKHDRRRAYDSARYAPAPRPVPFRLPLLFK